MQMSNDSAFGPFVVSSCSVLFVSNLYMSFAFYQIM